MSDLDINWFGEEFLVLATKANVRAMKTAASVVEREAKLSFGKGASRPFVRTKRGESSYHRPSAPGYAPNIDYGVLKSSVAMRITEGPLFVTGEVGSDINKMKTEYTKKHGKLSGNVKSLVQYGFFLEVGTKNMHARPWLRPALRKSRREILKIFKKANS